MVEKSWWNGGTSIGKTEERLMVEQWTNDGGTVEHLIVNSGTSDGKTVKYL